MSDRREPGTPYPIALCTTDLHVGGAERCVVHLATQLDPKRFCPTVYSLMPRPSAEDAELVNALDAANIKTRFLNTTTPRQFWTAVRQLANCWQRQRPALVQTFLFHANVVGACAARRAGVEPVVAGIRVADPRSRLRLTIEKQCTRNVARYVCVSEAVAAYAAQRGGLPTEVLLVIPNGVDVARFQDARPIDLDSLGCAADRRALVYVGRLDKQKRVKRLIEGFASVRQEIPNHDLILVGDGPERGELERKVQQLALGDRVHFAGRRHDVPEIIAACDALLLSSAWEGMPNVILEAMASGKPVVCSNVQGAAELLGPQADEQIVMSAADGDDPEWSRQFGKRLVRIVGNTSLAERLGHGNLVRAEQFSLQTMVSAYQRLYESLLDRRGARD